MNFCRYSKNLVNFYFVGVYQAIYFNNSEMQSEMGHGGGPQGILGALAANRISFMFDFHGPSLVFDTACSSSFAALVSAIQDLESGRIDNAIVGGVNLLFDPKITLEFQRYNMLAPDGKCKVFSLDRHGYVRSEAIISMLLQKRRHARRIYMKVLGGKMNSDGFSPLGMGCPRADIQLKLIKELYQELNIKPDDISYFEIHGTGEYMLLTFFYAIFLTYRIVGVFFDIGMTMFPLSNYIINFRNSTHNC